MTLQRGFTPGLTHHLQGLYFLCFLPAERGEERRPGAAQCKEQLTAFLSSALLCSNPDYGTWDRTDLSRNPHSARRESQESLLPREDGAKVDWECVCKNSAGQRWVHGLRCWTAALVPRVPHGPQCQMRSTTHPSPSACFSILKANEQKEREKYFLQIYTTGALFTLSGSHTAKT